MDPVFEWDPRKNRANLKKHAVGFEEAATIFYDPLAVIFADHEHSTMEDSEIIIGYSARGRLLVTSFREPAAGIIRIISARRATKTEMRDYEENVGN